MELTHILILLVTREGLVHCTMNDARTGDCIMSISVEKHNTKEEVCCTHRRAISCRQSVSHMASCFTRLPYQPFSTDVGDG